MPPRRPRPAPASSVRSHADAARATRHRTAAGLALTNLDDAAAFLEQMGLLLQSPHPYLPSLFGAAQGQPAKPGAGGFGQWPAHAWSWAGELAERDDVLLTKVLLGKRTLVHRRLWPALDAAVRERQPEDTAERAVLDVLAEHDAVRTDQLRYPGQEERAGKRALGRLEALGLVTCRPVLVDAHRHVALARAWTRVFPVPLGGDRGVASFVLAALHAAGPVPAHEPRRWFAWPRAEVDAAVTRLIEAEALRLQDGELACVAEPGLGSA